MGKHLHTTLADRFKYFTSPIRPCPDDIEIVRQQLSLLNKPARGILLGVTKELAELANDEIKIIAVDRSKDMIEHHWIGNNSNRIVKLADWLELESIATNINFVIGDGIFNVIDRKCQHQLMDCIRNVLADDGLLIVRVQCNPVVRETIKEIFENTTNNFCAFLSRLVNSICDSNFEVRGSEIFNKFKEYVTDIDIARFGWTKEDISIIEAHQNSSHVITFLTEEIFIKLCDQHQMKILSKFNGSYQLNERNPTFIIRKD
ncbi:unnamed protein product [Adineta steineri]|uniref:Methyltransferase domain-containing protein n=2 Tax=Adineta steineri TaxID=433720 RepID=A0A813SAQ8_9BILA|nr:unnamed protein product [Adineta steineri]CAF4125507.1 unnamed protein product [Adineta steineri]